ncbi:MAG TPA: DnaD domain protein [Lachnospiraceae bacterium]|jgi:DnaD/phage-associated family protein|nr:DnaD domain protein [Lachnospiraceae bacterium]
MNTFKIRSCFPQDVTVLSNEFLDRYMPEANGEFVKIYLFLMRAAGLADKKMSLSEIADKMTCTENDVLRALRYWEKTGVLNLALSDDGSLSGLTFVNFCSSDVIGSSSVSKEDKLTADRMAELGKQDEIRELLFIAQQYIGKPLSQTEMERILYFYDVLHFSPDLIDYLIEYCVSHQHKSIRYIEKVALSWHDSGITTVREARASVGSYHREYYDILKALGKDSHNPVDAEIRVMRRWLEDYHFSMEIIREACTRTVLKTSRPSLSYADGILTSWHEADVRTIEDIHRLDDAHTKKREDTKNDPPSKKKSPGGSFYNFEQRSYDYNELEKKLLNHNTEDE